MNRRHIATWNVLGLLGAAALVGAGCNDQAQQPTYGSKLAGGTPTMATATDDTVPPTMIPVGAKLLSKGTYTQILFTVPKDGSGSLFIYDEDTRQIVGQTNSVESMAGESKTMADLKNTAQGLNMSDHYRIYFAPLTPTTKPIGSM